MAEREIVWEASGAVHLGDSGYVVPSRVVVTGRATRGEPDLAARFEERAGTFECVEFTLSAQSDGRGVRSSDLRLFNLEGFTHNVFMRFARKMRTDEPGSEAVADERDWWEASGQVQRAQRRQESTTRAELTEVARIYQENLDSNPTKAVMDGMEYGSMRTAARRVNQARHTDPPLLPPTTAGKKLGWQ